MRIGLGKYFMTGCVTGIGAANPIAVFPSSLNLRGGLKLKADSGNTGVVYIGASGWITQGLGYPLRPGEFEQFPIDDVSGVFLLANTSSNKVFWFGV